MIILSLLREITFDEFPVSGGEKAEGGGVVVQKKRRELH